MKNKKNKTRKIKYYGSGNTCGKLDSTCISSQPNTIFSGINFEFWTGDKNLIDPFLKLVKKMKQVYKTIENNDFKNVPFEEINLYTVIDLTESNIEHKLNLRYYDLFQEGMSELEIIEIFTRGIIIDVQYDIFNFIYVNTQFPNFYDQNIDFLTKYLIYNLSTWAVYKSNFPLLKWAKLNNFPCTEMASLIAVSKGNLECLKYTHVDMNCKWNVTLSNVAAEMGKLDSLIYLDKNGCPLNQDVCYYAALKGHLDCLIYAHESGYELSNLTIDAASSFSNFYCLIYLIENKVRCDSKTVLNAVNSNEKDSLICLQYVVDLSCSKNIYSLINTINKNIEILNRNTYSKNNLKLLKNAKLKLKILKKLYKIDLTNTISYYKNDYFPSIKSKIKQTELYIEKYDEQFDYIATKNKFLNYLKNQPGFNLNIKDADSDTIQKIYDMIYDKYNDPIKTEKILYLSYIQPIYLIKKIFGKNNIPNINMMNNYDLIETAQALQSNNFDIKKAIHILNEQRLINNQIKNPINTSDIESNDSEWETISDDFSDNKSSKSRSDSNSEWETITHDSNMNPSKPEIQINEDEIEINKRLKSIR